jgi:hypothetical protein
MAMEVLGLSPLPPLKLEGASQDMARKLEGGVVPLGEDDVKDLGSEAREERLMYCPIAG